MTTNPPADAMEPISDEKLAVLRAVGARCGTVVCNEDEWRGLIARLQAAEARATKAEQEKTAAFEAHAIALGEHAEARRVAEARAARAYNEGIEAAAVWHESIIASFRNVNPETYSINIELHEHYATAIRALTREAPKGNVGVAPMPLKQTPEKSE